jgi:LuxR family quorum sensing-dependent transcriptional regulator
MVTLQKLQPGSRISEPRKEKKSSIFTSREAEVLAWVARGKSAWEIGEILRITKRTVDEHVRTAMRKIGASNRTHAVALALRDRLIEL